MKQVSYKGLDAGMVIPNALMFICCGFMRTILKFRTMESLLQLTESKALL